jgi:hypothetical protein
VIEGFPRSANSFAREAFLTHQRHIRYATHLHASSQVIQAVRWNVPTLVLLREPSDAVCADVAFHCQINHIDSRFISPRLLIDSLLRYITFYSRILPYNTGFVIGHFPDVISDFGKVMIDFNDYFQTDYNVFAHTDSAVQMISSLSHHIAPTAQRSQVKAIVREKYNSCAPESLKLKAFKAYTSLLRVNNIPLSTAIL